MAYVTQSGSNKYTPAGKDKRPHEILLKPITDQRYIQLYPATDKQILPGSNILYVFCVSLGSLGKKKCFNCELMIMIMIMFYSARM